MHSSFQTVTEWLIGLAVGATFASLLFAIVQVVKKTKARVAEAERLSDELRAETAALAKEIKLALSDDMGQHWADQIEVRRPSVEPKQADVFVPQKGGGALGRAEDSKIGGSNAAFGSPTS